ncbi:hypothetical protein F5J12DRAFT_786683 [Pisolithus orientalis]|uniref:uncharacterized protein n=1 Tax=Pisolithus orientalis TaxID=936130 RepID=UPI00222558FA|nr:uncharacterized protein F5J12DRAFT_786683 [Pisolithus orientalis]KAI5989412.1 hypothetical protein F5J12DRAFT_786683 [Pisolithus orientalis]
MKPVVSVIRLGYFNPWRITAVNQVLQPKTLVVSFPGLVVPETSSSGKVELGPGPINSAQVKEEPHNSVNQSPETGTPEVYIHPESGTNQCQPWMGEPPERGAGQPSLSMREPPGSGISQCSLSMGEPPRSGVS